MEKATVLTLASFPWMEDVSPSEVRSLRSLLEGGVGGTFRFAPASTHANAHQVD
jgi:hypothetical protein